MTKRLLIAFLSLSLTMHVAGCTSGGGQEDGDVAESNDGSFSEESNGDFADGGDASADAGSGDAPAEGGDTVADNLDDLGGEMPADDGGGEIAADAPAAEGGDLALSDAPPAEGGGDDLVLDTAEPLPEEAATDPAAAPDASSGAPDQVAAAPTDEPVFNTPAEGAAPEMAPVQEPIAEAAPAPDAGGSSEVASSGDAGGATEPAPAAAFVPVKKIRESAFAANDGTSLNRVYLARPGDTYKSVAQKIYGSNRSKDLRKWNGGRTVMKTGDKVYYASPTDTADTSMKVFYEDIGIQPSTYTSKDGDNIRVVSKQLLGNSQSWKEVWATNTNIESKGDVPAGLEIRYWPEGAEASATMAQTKPPSESVTPGPKDVASEPPPPGSPEMGAELPPPPPPQDVAMNDIPPPPPPSGSMPMDPGMAGSVDPSMGGTAGAQNVPPPPPPPPDIPPPPPPEPKPIKKQAMEQMDSEPEADQMMWLTAGGIMLMAAAILYVVIKKNRAKRIDLSHTQV